MNKINKLGFTFVEMIIAISIVVLLAVVGNSSLSTYKEKSNNSRVVSDLGTLNNSLLSYSAEKGLLPKVGGNENYFKADTSYAHSWTGADTFGAHGFITENTLPKRYLNYLPLDPITGQYYAYGRTKLDNKFEVAGVIIDSGNPIGLVNGDYTGDNGPYNLIREYNGPDFVYNRSPDNFPYNPYEKVLTAKIDDFSGSISDIKINGNFMSVDDLLSYSLKSGDSIYVATGSTVDLYFSDGTSSTLGDLTKASTLTFSDMSFNGDTNLFTQIKLALDVGTIWSKATSLGTDSSFEIYTTDSSAAVRGTIFGVSKDTNTDISVIQGSVSSLAKTTTTTTTTTSSSNTVIINAGESITITPNSTPTTPTPTTPTVPIDTLDPVGKLTNVIQLIVSSYEKTNDKLEIKFNLDEVLKEKSKFLRIDMENGDTYKIYKNNYKNLKYLTLTGGTKINNKDFKTLISNNKKVKFSFCGTKKDGEEVCTREKEVKLIDSKYSKADAGDCPSGTKEFNHECVEKVPGWELVAYAPYETGTGLYLKDGTMVTGTSSGTVVMSGTTSSGVYVGSSGTGFLAYSGSELDLGKDFMIEMRVKGLDRSSSSTSMVLLNSDTSKIKLLSGSLSYFKKIKVGYIKKDLGNGYLSGFYDIKITNKDISIFNIGDGKLMDSTGITMSTPNNNIYIGLENLVSSYLNQWDEIIDYIKIYKK